MEVLWEKCYKTEATLTDEKATRAIIVE